MNVENFSKKLKGLRKNNIKLNKSNYMSLKNMKEFNVIDLFAGCGGLSHGLIQAGFKIVAANEICKDAAKTYSINHIDTKMIVEDIVNIKPEDFLLRCNLSKKDIDFVVGGPPCQGFSMANRQRLINDPRNNLYKYFVDFVKVTNPKIFIMENVKGILHKANEIIKDFEDIGYKVNFKIINSKNYGIPQNRERVFFIGSNLRDSEKKINKIFNLIESKKKNTIIHLSDALWGLRKLKALPKKNKTSFESNEYGFFSDKIIFKAKIPDYILKINSGIPKEVFNHKARYNNPRDIMIFNKLPQGGDSSHPSISDIMPYKSRNHIFKDKYYKLKSNDVSKTITSHMKFDCNMYIHPFEDRGLTPREAARIQSFPDNYKFEGSYTKWYSQIGNAVPPMVAKIIGECVLEVLNEE